MTSGMLAGGCSRTRFNGQLAPGSHTTTVDFHQVRHWLGDRHHLPSGPSSIRDLLPLASGSGPVRSGLGGADARRQLERDLHDGAQNEIVALIFKLTRAEQDPGTQHGVLAVRVEDEGRGFDSEDTPGGVGPRNIHGRIQALGDTVTLTFAPGSAPS